MFASAIEHVATAVRRSIITEIASKGTKSL